MGKSKLIVLDCDGVLLDYVSCLRQGVGACLR